MQGKSRVRGAVAAVVVIASVGLGALSQAGPAAAAPAGPGGTWGEALLAPGAAVLATSGNELTGDEATNVSCASPGDCTAVGYYDLENLTTHVVTAWPMALTQTDGAWGHASALAGIAALSSGRGGKLTEISCASAGNCSAAGSYTGAGGTSFGFLANEVNGTWGAVQALPDAASLGTKGSTVSSISCPSAGDCAAVGGTPSEQFVLNEVNGSWGDPLAIPGLASLGTASSGDFDSVSCASAGDCTAIGTVTDSSGVQSAVLVTETGGTWGDAKLVPGQGALSSVGSAGSSVSCPAAGDCTAIGDYEPTSSTTSVWVADEVNGTWGAAQPLAAPATSVDATGTLSLSCPTPGNCAVAGGYVDAEDVPYGFLANEVNGVWQASQDVPGMSGVRSQMGPVSCSAPGDCAATVVNDPEKGVVFTTDEVNGTWGAATSIPGAVENSNVTALSCTAPGYCTAVGAMDPFDTSNDLTLVSEATGTVTTAKVGTTTVSYGDEEAAPVSVTVTSPDGGTPTGTVTVTGNPLVAGSPSCTATLVGGAGTCALPATAVNAGNYYIFATYNGDATYAASDAYLPLTVTPEATTTSVTLSAPTATYGHESALRLSAVVTPRYGGPFAGKVVIHTNVTAASNVACTLTVTDGRGSCLLSDTQLGIGVSHITAFSYNGDTTENFVPSVSATKILTTVKGSDRTTLTLSKTSVANGQENQVRLSVKVLPAYHGAPAGQVLVKTGSRTLCTISLKSEAGSCVLSARELGTGTYTITAGYAGNAFFTGSTSGRVSLKIT